MSKFGNISIIIMQADKKKIHDSEKLQEIERLCIESFKALAESERQLKISEELGEKAIELILVEDINIEALLEQIKKKVENNGVTN